MTTLTDLIASIIDDPLSTTRRLIVADKMDEEGQHERAEFIRVQVRLDELRRLGCHESEMCRVTGPCAECGREAEADKLRRRERELLDAHWLTWSPEPLLEMSGYTAENHDGEIDWHFRRGFIESVSLSEALWIGSPCERCGGSGYDGDVVVDLADKDCPDCNGSGRVNAHGPKIVVAAPVVSVTLTGKEPYEFTHGRWWWLKSSLPDQTMQQSRLFVDLWKILNPPNENSVPAEWDSEAAALAALSRACVAWARKLADLPAIDWSTP